MKIIFFDGICIMCNGFVDFVNKHDKLGTIMFCDIRSNKAKELLSKHDFQLINIDTIVFLNESKLSFKSEAILEILISLKGWFKCLVVLKIVPQKIRDYFYTEFAKRRLFFGEKLFCSMNSKLSNKIIK